jgi:hypothetical protein
MQISKVLQLIMTVISILAICSFANAQSGRADSDAFRLVISPAFVSGMGNDGGPCTRMAPCRTFQRAYDVVSFGGEVVALDAADLTSKNHQVSDHYR